MVGADATRRGATPLVMLLLMGLGSGCGGEDPLARASGPLMAAAPARSTAASAGPNEPPRIRSVHFEPPRPARGESVRAVVDAFDPDGDPVQLAYYWSVGGQSVASRTAETDLAWSRKGDEVYVSVTPSDGQAEGERFEVATRVRNRPPEIRSLRVEPVEGVRIGDEITAQVVAEDPDGDAVTLVYRWVVEGRITGEGGPSFSTQGLDRGDRIGLRVTATDGDDRSDAAFEREIVLANAAPVITSQPGVTDPDGVFRYRAQAEDPDGDRLLRFRLAEAPDGMEIDARRGEVEWRPRPDQAGRHTVAIAVSDRHGGEGIQRFELDVDRLDPTPGPASPAARREDPL